MALIETFSRFWHFFWNFLYIYRFFSNSTFFLIKYFIFFSIKCFHNFVCPWKLKRLILGEIEENDMFYHHRNNLSSVPKMVTEIRKCQLSPLDSLASKRIMNFLLEWMYVRVMFRGRKGEAKIIGVNSYLWTRRSHNYTTDDYLLHLPTAIFHKISGNRTLHRSFQNTN